MCILMCMACAWHVQVSKKTKIVALQKRIKRLLAQVEAQARLVDSRRADVDFGPADAEQCERSASRTPSADPPTARPVHGA